MNKGGTTNKPTTSNKTGSWRTFTPKITDKCTACKTCIEFCPEGIISIEEKAKINYDFCKGCMICAEVCPFKAVNKLFDKEEFSLKDGKWIKEVKE